MDTEWFLFGRDRKSDDWALVDNGASFDDMVKARTVFEGMAKSLRFKY